jgi:hypothetical protein
VLSLLSLINNTATLDWSIVNNDCIPISSYNIYENGRLIANVPYPINTFTYTNCDTNTFYVTSISGTTESEPSNTVTITSPIIPPVLTGVNNNDNTATLSWTINSSCNISQFNIYNYSTGSQIGSVNYPTTTFIVPLIGGNNYFYVTAIVSGGNTSGPSNIVNVNNPPPFTTTGTPQYISGYYIITFTDTSTSGTITFNRTIYNASIICVAGGGGGGSGYINALVASTGGGGGGGGNYQITNETLSPGTYSITVGLRGDGGAAGSGGNIGYSGDPGNPSTITNPSNTIIISCSGGGGGNATNNSSSGGVTGNVTIGSGGSGGVGGQGGNNNGSGGNSASYSSAFSIPTSLTSIAGSYCGGGGGGNMGANGGSCGNNGLGGVNNQSGGYPGQSALSYGSGGGGAGSSPGNIFPLVPSNFPGGNGANGVVIFYFLYP